MHYNSAGGAEMAGRLVARFPVDGRHGENVAVHDIVNTQTQEEPQNNWPDHKGYGK